MIRPGVGGRSRHAHRRRIAQHGGSVDPRHHGRVRPRGGSRGPRIHLGRGPHRDPAGRCGRIERTLRRPADLPRVAGRRHPPDTARRRRPDPALPRRPPRREADREPSGALRRASPARRRNRLDGGGVPCPRRRAASPGPNLGLDARVHSQLLRARRGDRERPALPVPASPGPAAHLCRRASAARVRARGGPTATGGCRCA